MNIRSTSLLLICGLLTAGAFALADTPKPAAPKPTAPKPTAKPAAEAPADESFPAQSSVAAKAAFGTVAASDSAVTKALNAKALAEAQKQVGKPGSFQGTVTQIYSPKNHSFVALDFAPQYRDALTANIAPEDYAKFPDLTQLVGKHVLVSGKFIAHGEATQLAVTRLDQIKIVP